MHPMSSSGSHCGRRRATRITRNSEQRLRRKQFLIVCEGAKTEPGYFKRLVKLRTTCVSLNIPKTKYKSSPKALLERMNSSLKDYDAAFGKTTGEAWIVMDRDNLEEYQLEEIYNWSMKKRHYNVAISDPQFEYWLILHFKDGKNDLARKKTSIITYLKRWCIPKYEKGKPLPEKVFDCKRINEAINRARDRDSPECEKWPTHKGCTTLYRLVERILNAKLE